MELWIRSQKRNILEKVSQLYVTTYDDGEGFGIYARNYDDLDDCDIPLGFYKTRERALEVLDEIQGKIAQNECLKSMISKLSNVKGEEEKIGKLFKEMIYEMPKE